MWYPELHRKVLGREVGVEELYAEGNTSQKLSPADDEQPDSNDINIDAIMQRMVDPLSWSTQHDSDRTSGEHNPHS